MRKYVIPNDIEEEAKNYIQDVVNMLENAGLMESVDSAALTMLARNYSIFIKASKQLEQDGLTVISDRGNLSPHPAIKIAKDAEVVCIKLMEKFGLTVKDRSKLPAFDSTDDSPLVDFVKSAKEIR